jgi:hypothetical protein
VALFKRKPKTSGGANVKVLTGDQWLEVKGESRYQRELESIAGPPTGEGHNIPIVSLLVREPDNPADRNAIAVHAVRPSDNQPIIVGYVNRDDAARMAPALDRMNRQGRAVGLDGLIRGGWDSGGGDTGFYGISLRYDPADFQ